MVTSNLPSFVLCSHFRERKIMTVFCLMANFLTRQDKPQNVKAELYFSQ